MVECYDWNNIFLWENYQISFIQELEIEGYNWIYNRFYNIRGFFYLCNEAVNELSMLGESMSYFVTLLLGMRDLSTSH